MKSIRNFERASVATDRIVGILDDLDNITKMEEENFNLKWNLSTSLNWPENLWRP